MCPLPNARVVPDGWVARHRPVVEGFFPDTVTIRNPTGEAVTDALGTETTSYADVAVGVPALVQAMVQRTTFGGAEDAAGRPVVVGMYTARLGLEWVPEAGALLIVTASPDPGNLGTYVVQRTDSRGYAVDRVVHLERASDGWSG